MKIKNVGVVVWFFLNESAATPTIGQFHRVMAAEIACVLISCGQALPQYALSLKQAIYAQLSASTPYSTVNASRQFIV